MPDEEKIYDSPPSEPEDEFWLDQGKKMIEDSMRSVRDAAKSLMTGLGLLKTIYLGILGFADFIPARLPQFYKSLFIVPLLFWLFALYHCLLVMMTKRLTINLHSPDNIRSQSGKILMEKQKSLQWAFWSLRQSV